MKILHVGSCSSPYQVDGLNNTIWLVAREQALKDHQVTLLLDNSPDEVAIKFAENIGVKLVYIPVNRWGYNFKKLDLLLNSDIPDIVHMHSVFVYKQIGLAKYLFRNKIPYIITPHGGLDSQRSKIKKIFYSLLVEKQRFYKASAITVVTSKEQQTIRAFVPNYKGKIHWVSNPFDGTKLNKYKWKGNIDSKKLVFLGRFDVIHKGLDILVEIAKLMPELEFHLYGREQEKTRKLFTNLRHNSPLNVYFHKPIFEEDKFDVLVNASLYIQTSRWEGFPLSIVEAMYIGLPCAISDMPNFAELFHEHDLGLLLSANPQESANRLRKVLSQPNVLQRLSKRAEEFAMQKFRPSEVALNYLNIYKEVSNSQYLRQNTPD